VATALQSLHLRAFRRSLRTAGLEFAFGEATFEGILSTLRPDDPRLEGASKHLLELVVATEDLPDPRPRKGDTLTWEGTTYRVSETPASEPASGLTSLLLVA
jgi:hypothetical protein